MKITFLGTGTSQGVPVIGCQCKTCLSENKKNSRLRSSILIQNEDTNIVIDAGPDFRYQILRSGITSLDGILITHGHKDHVGGLDDIRAFNYQQKKAMNVYAANFAFPDLHREFHYAFDKNRYPGTPQINLVEVDESPFNINGIEIQSILVQHYNNPVFGYRIENFTYITDANFISTKELKKVEGSEIIVLNALRKEKHISHFNLEEAVQLLKELKPKKAYLTHIGHLMGTYEEVSKELPDFINLAYDNLQFEVN